jgi:hypothetical protein
MRPVEKEGVAVVMLGSFNPSIFQPRWLASLEMIRPEEAENATIAIIQTQVADFQTEWFRLQVLQNRFMLQSLDATHYEPVRDLAAGIFRLLPHTPVNRLGVTRWFHFPMENVDVWNGVGHRLAPKELWRPLMDGPGLRSLLMEGHRPGAEGAVSFVKIEPSLLVNPGVFIEVTEEYAPKIDVEVSGASWAPERLNRHWEAVIKYAEEVSQNLLKAVLET